MDSRMRDVSGSGPRSRGGQRSRRNEPYEKPAASGSRMASATAWDTTPTPVTQPAMYPPPAISIKGSGGPYVVVVGNVAKGTSPEDIKMTFEPFGELVEVKERPPPSLNYPSISFEVSFVRKEDGKAACHALNGCLADGRVLSVAAAAGSADSGVSAPAFAQFNGQVSAAARQRVGETGEIQPGPAPVPRGELLGPVPVTQAAVSPAPASPRGGSGKRAAAPASPARAAAAGGRPANAPAGAAAPAAAPASLQSRLGMGLTASDKARIAAIKKTQRNGPLTPATAPPGAAGLQTNAAKKAPMPKSLKDRIAVPLAERLAAAGASKSDIASADAKKRKREAQKAKAAGAGAKQNGAQKGRANRATAMDWD